MAQNKDEQTQNEEAVTPVKAQEGAAETASSADDTKTAAAETETVGVKTGEDASEAKTTAQSGAHEQEKPVTKKQKFLQFLKFALFSASAGAIQLLSTTTLHQWTGWLIDYYWIAYVIGLTLSVIWNFTFNRKFTFKASSNVPIAMVLVVIYNLIIVVPMAYGGQKLEELWGPDLGIVVTVISLLINFITEFFWDKFIVFNDKVINRLEKKFSRKKKSAAAEAAATADTQTKPEHGGEPEAQGEPAQADGERDGTPTQPDDGQNN